MKIHTYDSSPLFADMCPSVAERVMDLQDFWINRGGFYTLGAATYQDCPLAYPAIANAFNPIIEQYFSSLLRVLQSVLSRMHCRNVVRLNGVGLPSFHIFTPEANGMVGSPHVDEPYKRVRWPSEISNPFSFTLPVMLPACGGGMNVWPDCTEAQIDHFAACGELPPAEYFPYEVGKLYTHSGETPHQIASTGDLAEGEARITLQGHGVTLASGEMVLYF